MAHREFALGRQLVELQKRLDKLRQTLAASQVPHDSSTTAAIAALVRIHATTKTSAPSLEHVRSAIPTTPTCHIITAGRGVPESCAHNGYTSILSFYQKAVSRLSRHIGTCPVSGKGGYEIQKTLRSWRIVPGNLSMTWTKELVAWEALFEMLDRTLDLAQAPVLMRHQEDSLFVDLERMDQTERSMMFRHLTTEPAPYGRTIAFQFDDSLYFPINSVSVLLAAYSDTYTPNAPSLSTALRFPAYILDPELKASKVAKVFRNLNMGMIKDFWQLTDTDAFVLSSKLTTPRSNNLWRNSRVNRVVFLPDQDGRKVAMRLIADDLSKPSRLLILHIHGGGFVAMSSKSHQLYLAPWVNRFKHPVLCVDYGLSPELPFPCALNDCLAAYQYAIANAKELGWTGEKIVLMGDSAGGNLCATLSFKLRRISEKSPDGLLLFYPVFNIEPAMSPSRLLSMFDVVLNGNTAMLFALAYVGVKEVEEVVEGPEMGGEAIKLMERLRDRFNDVLVSPMSAADEEIGGLPPCHFFVSNCDPVLDDSVAMATRLERANVPNRINLVEDVPHGFLNMLSASRRCCDAYLECGNELERIFRDILSK